jgi:hypothetical protein
MGTYWLNSLAQGDTMHNDPRAAQLNPAFEMKIIWEEASFPIPVNKTTGEPCVCITDTSTNSYKWNEAGTELRCIHCNYDGT